MARAIGCGSYEGMTQSLPTSFFDQTRRPGLGFHHHTYFCSPALDPPDIVWDSLPSMLCDAGFIDDDFFSSLDHVTPDAP